MNYDAWKTTEPAPLDERDDAEKTEAALASELKELRRGRDCLRVLLAQAFAEKEQALLRAERAERDLETLQNNLRKLVTK